MLCRIGLAALLACLLSPLARAQPGSEPRPRASQDGTGTFALAAGGLLVGSALGIGAGSVAASGGEALPTILAFEAGYALGVGLGVPLAGDLLGLDGDRARAMRKALVGGAIGVGVTGALLLAARGGGLDTAFTMILIGGGAAVVLPVALSVSGYRLAPTVTPLWGAQPSPGLSLHVAL